MAAVTLKDLMDPLTKIQAATESSSESLDAMNVALNAQIKTEVSIIQRLDKLIAVNTQADSLGAGDLLLIREQRMQTNLLKKIAGAKDGGSKGGALGKSSKGFKDGAEALKLLGAGASTLAKGLLIFKFVPKKAITKFKDSLYDLYEVMQEFDTKKVKEGAEAFALMANSIGKFAVGLVKAAILLPIGMLGIKLLGVVIKMATPIFANLGKKSKDVNKGAKALDLMGSSMLSFAKGLALAGIVSVVGLVAVPFLILSIGLLGGAFFLLGKIATPINRGSKALDKMGDALKSFALGLAGFALVTFFILMKPIILVGMVASLVLIGGAVAILGKMSKQIRKGTATLALMGLGIALFGFGYAIFASQFPENVGLLDIVVQAAAIALIGGAVALVGKFGLKNAAVGAAALALNGLALLVFLKGYEPYAKATKGLNLKDVLVQAGVIVGIGLAAALVGKFGIQNIAMGALAMSLNGIGLWIFTIGYVPFAAATRGMTIGDVGIQAAVLTGVGGIMTLAGIAVAASAGSALLGPALFAAAGGALLLLAPGLQAMRDLNFTTEDGIALATTLGAISMAFAGTTPGEGEEGGLWSGVKGAFSRVGESGAGVAAAAMYGAAGLALQSLAKGLVAFKAIKFTKEDSADLALALGSVSAAFAQAGGEASPPGGLFGDVFGNAFSPNAVENGIDSVMDAGEALTSIATGLNAFQGLKDPVGLADKIGAVIGMVGKAFASIGGADMEEKDGGSFLGFTWDENVIEKGIDSIMDAGEALTGIAEGLNKFQGLKDPKATAGKIKDVLSLVGGAFAAIGGQEEKDGGSFLGFTWDENVIEKGIDAVDGAGKSLTDIATGLNGFANIDATKVSASIGTFLTSISSTFKELYEKNANISEQLEDFSSFIVTLGDVAKKGYLDKAADGISKIADSINKIDVDKTIAFGELFRSSAKLQDDDDAYEALAQAVEDIRDILKSSDSGKSTPSGNTANPTSTNTPTTSGSNITLNATLRSLSRAITDLPISIASMELVVTDPNR